MTAFVRIVMQLLVARLLAIGPIGDLADLLFDSGVTEDQLVDGATIVALGLLVAIPKLLESTGWGARIVEWWNLILSWGRSASGPEYQPKHLG